jgi:NDP-sugar pyrophosphorylase family protein
MKSILIAYLFANGITSFQMVTYNEIHSELAEDCAIEIENTDSFQGYACRRYFDFLDTAKDLRSINRAWLSQADLSPEEREEVLYFIERGNRAMSYIVQRSNAVSQR